MRPVYIREPDGTKRRVDSSAFPLAIGGRDADIPIPDSPSHSAVAHIGIAEGDVFIQPANGAVSVGGVPIAASTWLHDGDVVSAGGLRIEIEEGSDGVRFCVERANTPSTDPPLIVDEPRAQASTLTDATKGDVVRPVSFQPTTVAKIRRGRRAFGWRGALFWATVLFLGGTAWAVFNARTVAISIVPTPDRLSLSGSPFAAKIGDRFLVHPGPYQVVAEKDGYRPLDVALEITAERNQEYEFSLQRLPGRLAVLTTPADGALVSVDASEIGTTPIEPIELSPGTHQVLVSAPGYRDFQAEVEVHGEGTLVELAASLEPRFAPITFDSEPKGATIRVAGKPYGPTPVTTNVLEGTHDFEATLDGYQLYRGSVHVVAGAPQTVATVGLVIAPGQLSLESVPAQANVTLDGDYQGQTPVDLYLTPGQSYSLDVSRPGYDSVRRDISVASQKAEALTITLDAQLGEIELIVDPPDAQLVINGESRGNANQVLELPAASHRIEITKDQHESFAADITPRPGFPQTIEVDLKTLAEVREASILPVIKTSKGHELRRIEPVRFEMGASRREPGRRANESIRTVELTRDYYLGTTEVTNRQFREFRAAHRSGDVKGLNLETDHHPVVRVSWQDAAAYCNWLSALDSLPAAYVDNGGTLVPAKPANNGYRLPTEAEWSFAARYAGGERTKYVWGSSLPVAAGSANYADESAKGLIATIVSGYNDGFAATAPVDSFSANALGMFNMGGNVGEWVQDLYTIYPSGAAKVVQDPTGPPEGEFYVIRGAGWMHGSITELRLTYRDYGSKPRPDVGFRIARNVE